MSEVKRWLAPHPGITRDLKEVVLARDFDSLSAENKVLREALVDCYRFAETENTWKIKIICDEALGKVK